MAGSLVSWLARSKLCCHRRERFTHANIGAGLCQPKAPFSLRS